MPLYLRDYWEGLNLGSEAESEEISSWDHVPEGYIFLPALSFLCVFMDSMMFCLTKAQKQSYYVAMHWVLWNCEPT